MKLPQLHHKWCTFQHTMKTLLILKTRQGLSFLQTKPVIHFQLFSAKDHKDLPLLNDLIESILSRLLQPQPRLFLQPKLIAKEFSVEDTKGMTHQGSYGKANFFIDATQTPLTFSRFPLRLSSHFSNSSSICLRS